MFKRPIAFLLMLAFTMQTFSGAAMVTGYYANRAAYARNCENKAKPQMHCNGKCQLMKKLRQEEKKNEQNPERRSNKEEVLSSTSYFTSLHVVKWFIHMDYAAFMTPSSVSRPRTVFHPPGA